MCMIPKRMIIEGEYYLPDFLSPEIQELIKEILKMDPQSRLPLEEIMVHPWVEDAIYEDAYDQYCVVPNKQESMTNRTAEKAWKTMRKYGISGKMMLEAADKGARNSIVGTYRIVLYQIQMRKIAEQKLKEERAKNGEAEQAEEEQRDQDGRLLVKKQSSKLCTIL